MGGGYAPGPGEARGAEGQRRGVTEKTTHFSFVKSFLVERKGKLWFNIFNIEHTTVPSALAPHGQRASTLMVQVVTVCEPPELAR